MIAEAFCLHICLKISAELRICKHKFAFLFIVRVLYLSRLLSLQLLHIYFYRLCLKLLYLRNLFPHGYFNHFTKFIAISVIWTSYRWVLIFQDGKYSTMQNQVVFVNCNSKWHDSKIYILWIMNANLRKRINKKGLY